MKNENSILSLTRPIAASTVHYMSAATGTMISSWRNVFTIYRMGETHRFRLPLPWKRRPFALTRLTARLGRLDKGNAVFSPDGSAIIIVYFGSLYRIDLHTMALSKVGELEQGRNVLHQGIAIGHDAILIGEYGMNFDFAPVKIWRSLDQGLSFHVVHEFPSNSIFHTHGVYLDPVTKDFWIPTGDFEGQCHLYRASPDFSNIEKIGDGSQKYRAVSLMFSQDRITWGMDSPVETSRIMSIDRRNHVLREGHAFKAPVWFTKRLEDDVTLLQTTIEPGEGVQTSVSEVYASLDEENWVLVYWARKDIWPMGLFKFGNIAFADGPQTSQQFTLFAEALRGLDGQAFEARLDMDRLRDRLTV